MLDFKIFLGGIIAPPLRITNISSPYCLGLMVFQFIKTFVVIMNMLETHANCNAFLCLLINESIKAPLKLRAITNILKNSLK